MALSESTVIDKIEVFPDGQIQVRFADIISRDGEEISRTFRRDVLDPGRHTAADVASKYGGTAGVPVGDIAQALWTEERVQKRKDDVRAKAGARLR
jgi:hypothetical protein